MLNVSGYYAASSIDTFIGCLTQQHSVIISLPAITSVNESKIIVITDVGGNALTNNIHIKTSDGAQINGTVGYILNTDNGSVVLIKNVNAWNAVADISNAGNGGSSNVPSYDTINLPSPTTSVQLAKLADGNKGLIYSNAINNWLPVTGGLSFIFEDFGGIPNDSSTASRIANNQAWDNCMNAIPINSDRSPSGTIILGAPSALTGVPTTYYFNDTVTHARNVIVSGLGGSFRNPLTQLVFPTGTTGIATVFFDAITGASSEGGGVRSLGITQDALPPVWNASTTYVTGAIIQPTKWCGYVFINNGSSGKSGSTEPSWPIIIGKVTNSTNGPYSATQTVKVAGQNVTDSGVTWTSRFAHGIYNICDHLTFENIYINDVAGDGIRTVGNSNAPPLPSSGDLTRYYDIGIERTLSNGIFMIGHDANISYGDRVNIINCYGYGWQDESIAGCYLYSSHARSNGYLTWGNADGFGPGYNFPPNSFISPTDPNGFAYKTTAGGTSGAFEPTWPTSLGATVLDGTVTWVCDRVWTGGNYRTAGGTLTNCYQESGIFADVGSNPGENGGYLGGNLQPTPASDSQSGWHLNSKVMNGSLAFNTSQAASVTHFIQIGLGDPIHHGELSGLQVIGSNWADGSSMGIDISLAKYNVSDGTWNFGTLSGASYFTFPTVNSSNTPDIAMGLLGIPQGFRFSGVRNYADTFLGHLATTTEKGDLIFQDSFSTDSIEGGYTYYRAITAGPISTTAEIAFSNLAPNFKGGVIDFFQPLAESDLHICFDDQLNRPGATQLNITDRIGNYSLTAGGTTFNDGQRISPGVHTSFGQNRRSFEFTGVDAYTLGANNAHTLQTTDQWTVETLFLPWQPSAADHAMWGYLTASGHCGYSLVVQSDKSVRFKIFNNAGGTYVDLATAASAIKVSNPCSSLITVTIDMVNSLFAIYVNGALKASTASISGSYLAATAPIGYGAILQNGSWSGASTNEGGPCEILRTRRLLSPLEIANRSQQVASYNQTTVTSPPTVSVSVTGNYTATVTIKKVFVNASTTCLQTLPDASKFFIGSDIAYFDISGSAALNNISFTTVSGQTIAGQAPVATVINQNYGTLVLTTDGNNWWIE